MYFSFINRIILCIEVACLRTNTACMHLCVEFVCVCVCVCVYDCVCVCVCVCERLTLYNIMDDTLNNRPIKYTHSYHRVPSLYAYTCIYMCMLTHIRALSGMGV